MCNEINLEELEALANAAGGLKWIACGPSYGEAKPAFLDEVNVDDDEYPEAVCQYPAGSRSDVSDKMAYIAEANPATLLSLLDRLKSAEAERDAMAAKLAELEGQEPVATLHNASGCVGGLSIENHAPDLLEAGMKLYARPVPAEPVNTRLLDVATGEVQHIYAGLCPDAGGGSSSRDPECPACRAISAAESKQVGPVRLTDEEIKSVLKLTSASGLAARIARLTENAVLERNGLKPIPTAVTVAPRGYSWHGDRLQKDELGTLTRNPQAKGD